MDFKEILRFYQLVEKTQNDLERAQIELQEAKMIMDRQIEQLENILGKEVKHE